VSGRHLLASGRVWLSRPDDSVERLDMRGSDGRTIRLHVWKCATCPHVYEATHVRTGLMIRPDGDPTASINHGHRNFSLAHKISPLASSE
jgi:hypothetical protein